MLQVVNLRIFKELIKKATFNYAIESLKIDVEDRLIHTSMTNHTKDFIAILTKPNNLFMDIDEKFSMNFANPNTHLLKFINIFDDELVNYTHEKTYLKLYKDKIKTKVNFCSNLAVTSYDNVLPETSYDFTITKDEKFNLMLKKILKLGPLFDKIYITVKDGTMYIESTDKKINTSHGIELDVMSVDFKDFNVCFSFQNFNNLMSITDDGEYMIKMKYKNINNLDSLLIRVDNETETYYLRSIKDI